MENRKQDIEKATSLIFVCSPYGGDIDMNTTNARRFCRFVFDKGTIPFAPHLLFPQFLDEHEPAERNTGISMGVEVLRHCDEVWAFGRRISPGMAYELTIAESMGKYIRHFDEVCREIEVTT